jgi:hypothetical protein
VEAGWSREDAVPLIAPFLYQSYLKWWRSEL